MATESPEMERTSFVRCLWQSSAAPLQVGLSRPRGAAAMPGRGETEAMKNESTHSNNCSGSIIPTLEQLVLMCVSMHQENELLNEALIKSLQQKKKEPKYVFICRELLISSQPKAGKDKNRLLTYTKVNDFNNIILSICCLEAGQFCYTLVVLVRLFILPLYVATYFSLSPASFLYTISVRQLCLHLRGAASPAPQPQPVLSAVCRLIPVTHPPKVIWSTFLSAALWDIWTLRPVFWRAICTPSSYLC